MALNKEKALANVAKRIVPVSKAEPHIKVLVYGRNGRGKTRFAATAPKPLIVDCNERGTKSVRNYPNAYVFRANKWEDLTYVYWYLKEGNHKYESVILDTLSQAQNLCMKHILAEAEDRDPNRPPSMPDRRAWGQLGELMKPLMLNYRNLNLNVVFVCQERIDKFNDDDEGESTPRIVPDLSPSVRATAMASVEVMGRIYRRERRVGKGKREKVVWESRMLVGDHEDYETKDRTGNLPRIIREPTIPMMIEAASTTTEE